MKLKVEYLQRLNIYFMLSMFVPFVFILGGIVLHFSKKTKLLVSFIFKIVPFLFLLLLLLFIAIYRGNENILIIHHMRDYIIFITVAFYLTVVCQNDSRGTFIAYNSIKQMYLLMAVIKIMILIYAYAFSVPMGELLDNISDSTGIPMMQAKTLNDYIFRLQFPIDPVIPFLLYFLIKEFNSGSNKKIALMQFSLLTLSLILTMSRAFWLVGFLLVFIAFYKEFNLSKKLKVVVTSSILAVVLLFTTNMYQYLEDIIGSRIGGEAVDANYYSDLERTIQTNAILKAFYENPILGKGLGYYIPGVIRDEDDKYLYESQNLSILMDFGLILFIVFLISVLLNVIKNNYHTLDDLFMAFIFFCIWVFFGSVNPLLIGMTGGLIIFFALNNRSLNNLFSSRK